jgi:hypothetical protein
MHQYVTEHIFRDTIKRLRPDNFTWGGLAALFDHLDEYESYEFDPIGICCEYSEYKDLNEIQEAYDVKGLNEDEVKEWLADNGSPVIEHDDGIIIRDF